MRPSFLQGASFNLSAFSSIPSGAEGQVAWIRSNLSSFDRLSNRDCLTAYFDPLVTNHGDLLLILDDTNITTSDGSDSSILTWQSQCLDCAGSLDWLCGGVVPDFIQDNSTSHPETCTIPLVRKNLQKADQWAATSGLLGYQSARVSYCLSQPVPGRCSLEYSRALTIVVIVWNAFKIVMMIVASLNTSRTLMTLGDVIYTYLEKPDTLSQIKSAAGIQQHVQPKLHRKWKNWLTYDARKEMKKATESLDHPRTRGYLFWFETVGPFRLGAAFGMSVCSFTMAAYANPES